MYWKKEIIISFCIITISASNLYVPMLRLYVFLLDFLIPFLRDPDLQCTFTTTNYQLSSTVPKKKLSTIRSFKKHLSTIHSFKKQLSAIHSSPKNNCQLSTVPKNNFQQSTVPKSSCQLSKVPKNNCQLSTVPKPIVKKLSTVPKNNCQLSYIPETNLYTITQHP